MSNEILDGLDDLLDGLDDIGEEAEPVKPKSNVPRAKKPVKATAPVQAAITAAEAVGAIAAAALAPAPVPPAPVDPMAAQHGFSGRKLKIIIDKGRDKDDPTTVFLRLNQYEAYAQRGVPVELYEEVVASCLDNAVQTIFAQPSDGVLIPHDSLRFPYRIVR
ncbi:MAG: hypothetical protein ACREA0_28050 [bacterium]